MAASERLSSARVPRSVVLAAATSSMISSRVEAGDSTAPVQVASPIVRKRTIFFSHFSPSESSTKGVFASQVPPRKTTSLSWEK